MIHIGDCLLVMRTLDANSVDAIVTDPPYGIGFMGKAWDGKDIEARMDKRRAMPSADPSCTDAGGHRSAAAAAGMYDLSPKGMKAFQQFTADWCREALRVLKPGGYLVSFASPRTYHRMACGIEEAGFELRDQIMWLFGSGFPKSHNGEWGGTALKPAHEPIALARKPLIGTVAANWQAHGTGGLNIEGCRVPTEESLDGGAYVANGGRSVSPSLSPTGMNRPGATAGEFVQPSGRWPANLVHDGSDDVIAAFPDAPWQMADASTAADQRKTQNAYGAMRRGRGEEPSADSENRGAVGFAMRPGVRRLDAGSAARFFYCAKASREDRNDGVENPGPQFQRGATLRDAERVASNKAGNHHPTVKPTDLMRWLCRLVTPPGGLILDPFAGSGSTGRGAIAEGFQFIGIELDPEYAAIAQARIRAVQPGLSLGVAA